MWNVDETGTGTLRGTSGLVPRWGYDDCIDVAVVLAVVVVVVDMPVQSPQALRVRKERHRGDDTRLDVPVTTRLRRLPCWVYRRRGR